MATADVAGSANPLPRISFPTVLSVIYLQRRAIIQGGSRSEAAEKRRNRISGTREDMGIAKSKDTVSGMHGGSRIRSSLARAAGAIGSAIERLGTFFALAIAVAVSTAAQIWWISVQHIDSTGYRDGHLLQYYGMILSAGDPDGVLSYSPGVPFISQASGTQYMLCFPYQSGLVLLWSWLYSTLLAS